MPRCIRIGLANIDTTVGAFDSNTENMILFAKEASAQHATIVCFPEQVISGYPCEDLVQWKKFIDPQWEYLMYFISETQNLEHRPIYVVSFSVEMNGCLYNAAAVIQGGEILGIVPKEKLPGYTVFDEPRTYSVGIPGMHAEIRGIPFGDFIFQFPFGTFEVETCEDVWSPDGPMKRRAFSGAELSIIPNGSPYRAGVVETRKEMISTRAADNCITVAYLNLVGGNDGLAFDGGGYVNQGGRMIYEGPRWKTGLHTVVVDLDVTRQQRMENSTWRRDREGYLRTNQPVETIVSYECPEFSSPEHEYTFPPSKSFFIPEKKPTPDPETVYFQDLLEGMIMGLGGYFEKSGVFKRIGIALSGGKDSALALLISWLYAQRKFDHLRAKEKETAVRDFIYCFSMSTRHNSLLTRTIAKNLANGLDVSFKEISIQPEYELEVAVLKEMFPPDTSISRIARQNVQSRIRATRMQNWANCMNGFWIQTGNMSEKLQGYTTIGGDLQGAYSLLGDVPKTVVIGLLRYMEAHGEELNIPVSLETLISSKSSAELADNQEDEVDLMPFPVLDACGHLFVGEKKSPVEVYRALRRMWTDDELRAMRTDYVPGMLKTWVREYIERFFFSIFKWVQSPLSVHLGSLDPDRERALQIPVIQSHEWLDLRELEQEE